MTCYSEFHHREGKKITSLMIVMVSGFLISHNNTLIVPRPTSGDYFIRGQSLVTA